jgi:hypothetical protein
VSLLALAGAALASGAAGADGPVGTDPAQNYPAGPMPVTCNLDGTTPGCVDAAVNYLNQARASLGQAAYGLPSNFDSLTAPQQDFVLANLDRVLYGLTPIPGITDRLGQDAEQGVANDNDPTPSDPDVISYTSNWAGGFQNFPLAYEAWMYDDGPGSGNLDCTPADASGCWGHRHDVLWKFDPGGALAMGVATGVDSVDRPGYAMLIVQGDSEYRPAYTYTWAQAVAAGARPAGTPASTIATVARPTPKKPTTAPERSTPRKKAVAPRISRVRVKRRTVSVTIAAPKGARLQCALTPSHGRIYARDRFHRCSARPAFHKLGRGRYRLRVRSTAGLASRVLIVH